MSKLDLNWHSPPKQLALSQVELDIWAARLDQTTDRTAALSSTLSEPEKARASAFRFEKDRNRFIVGRGVLRALLGRYLNLAPQQLEFRYGPHGKPELAGSDEAYALHFNLAHSDDLGLFAFTRAGAVGVDVEKIRVMGDEQGIADRFFTRRESEGLIALRDDERTTGFFKLWTCKEAWLKATGAGISESLAGLEVSFEPNEPTKIVRIGESESEAEAWSLIDLAPAPGFCAAVAVRKKNLQVRCRAWNE